MVVVCRGGVGPEQRRAPGDRHVLTEERARGVGLETGGQGGVDAVGAVDELGALGIDDEGQRQQHGDGEHLGDHVLHQPDRREGHQHHADGGPQAGVGDGVELDALHALHARHGRRRLAP